MGLGLPIFGVYLLVLGIAKYVIFRRKSSRFILANGLDWDFAIAQESKRKQFLLRFFALFTRVKGIQIVFKRRAYLDFILKEFRKYQENLAEPLSPLLSEKWRFIRP